MKKICLLLLVLALCLPAHCFATENETHAYIIALLEAGEYDAAIEVIEGLKAQNAPAGDAPGGVRFDLAPETNGANWMFHMDIINDGDSAITLEALRIIDTSSGAPFGTHEFSGADLQRIGLEDFILGSGEGRGWDDGHPVVPDFDHREYVFIFRTEDGSGLEITFAYDLTATVPQAPAGGDWFFPITMVNEGDEPLQLVALVITDLMDGRPLGSYPFEGEETLAGIGLGNVILQPGQSFNWSDGHPATSNFNGREYRFDFRNGAGEIESMTFRFENLDRQGQPVDYSADPGQDLATLRHDADFEVEVAPGVYWVPASALGGSRYSNMDVYAMLPASPEEKQAAASTLYEALQFYQVGGFMPADDNIRLMENGVNWEHHKPGYHAVRTNCGCCASDSNWLRYMLDGDYDEIGYIATSQRDGSGHVYNYILQDGSYYFIDLTHYHAGSNYDTGVEDGSLSSYYACDFLLGNIHRTESVQAYVDYVQQTSGDAPGLMFMYTAENTPAVDGVFMGEQVDILYEEAEGLNIRVIFDDTRDKLYFKRAPSPQTLPDWSQAPDAVFPG